MLKKRFILLISCCLLITGKVWGQLHKVEAYIDQYKILAIKEMVRTGVPAAISLAQGIVESGAGTTWLAIHANNQFGIKCKNDWLGETVFHHDDRKNECFRKYPSAIVSWQDHSNFLKSSRRYNFLFYLDPLDYKAWAYGLKQAGYATSKSYAKQLIQTIQKYDLNQYSRKGLAIAKNRQPDDDFASLLNKKTEEQPEKETFNKEKTYPKKLFQINKRAALYLPKGTQLISIAEKFNIPLRRLLRYNEIDTDVLPRGMLIFVEKKRRKGSHKTHRVQEGETYHEIAQEEGIRLKWLLKRNYLSGEEPLEDGDILVLKGRASTSGGKQKNEGFFSRLFHSIFGQKSKQEQPAPKTEVKQITTIENKTSSPVPSKKAESTFLEYKVKPGDTLYGISQRFGVSIERIRKTNHMKGNLIKAGQKLRIPEKTQK